MDVLSALSPGAGASATPNNQSLGQQDFMRLLIAQFQAQNPLEPLGNTEFIGQLAQFSVVSGVQQLDSSFQGFAQQLTGDQVLQGASLLGKPVQRISDQIGFDGTSAPIMTFDVPPGAAKVEVDVLNASGVRVAQLIQNNPAAGDLSLAWDGLLADGSRAPAGLYSVQARAVAGDATAAMAVRTEAIVTGIKPTSQGLQLVLDDGSTTSLNDVTQIRAAR
ncbi:MAG: hypothetical protein CMK02_06175 [Polycyclovorans sp.]|nr:hypothetical protein [Polycyclovorans sp.]|tara:strand:- start:17529 stop:18188 length:660 start_codon:yes stop_codon:yes gene_type:complete